MLQIPIGRGCTGTQVMGRGYIDFLYTVRFVPRSSSTTCATNVYTSIVFILQVTNAGFKKYGNEANMQCVEEPHPCRERYYKISFCQYYLTLPLVCELSACLGMW